MQHLKKVGLGVGLGGTLLLLGGCMAIFNKPPVAEFSWSPLQPYAKQEVRFDASGSYDPDGEIVRYVWNFGDGTSGEGKIVTHIFADDGHYTVSLTVYDKFGKTASTSKVVEVLNPPPEIKAITVSGRPIIGETIVFSVSAYDPASHQTAEVKPLRIVSYRWDFGDGTSLITDNPVATHIYRCAGRYTVLVTVTDDDGATASASTLVNIYGINRPPIACFVWQIQGNILFADASCSRDNDLICLDGRTSSYTISRYYWELYCDNQRIMVATGVRINYQLTIHGNYLLRLVVTDDEGSSAAHQVSFVW